MSKTASTVIKKPTKKPTAPKLSPELQAISDLAAKIRKALNGRKLDPA